MGDFFVTILYQPIFNGVIGLYNLIPDIGAVILIITVIIKLALYPMTTKSIKAQKSLSDLQPKLADLKKKHTDKQVLAQETMKLYKEHKVNPFGSCLPLLIQLPIFIALYWVLKDVFTADRFDLLYTFVSQPESINPMSLGFINLAEINPFLAVCAGLSQFWQAKMFQKKKAPEKAGKGAKDENMMAMMNKQMLYFMPVMTFFIGLTLPGGVTLYWFLSTLTTALQQKFLFNKKTAPADGVIEGEIVDKK
ncbi:MAG: membrane protein insertase YidC [Candidatus Magasanikbacteria bacterium]|jgi:YidC/Oxa1 family membrane protein insertase|nr:membrane protein insertase YidC [Candidatus Magasanikbacteria bacterium]